MEEKQTPNLSTALEGKVAFTIEPGVVQFPGGKIDLRSCSWEQYEKAKKYLKHFVKEAAVTEAAPATQDVPAQTPAAPQKTKTEKAPEEK